MRVLIAVATMLISAETIRAADLILNEYNAVGGSVFLAGDGTDTFWQRVEGNGGDWIELVVITDHLDIRGWQLLIRDNIDANVTLTFTQADIWSDLRAGTIITVSEELGNNVNDYNPALGKWWINIKAAANTAGTFITASNFPVNKDNWQLTIEDAAGSVVFGPAGEGVMPASGVSDEKVWKLEEDPTEFITPLSNFSDGQSSTFGAPNIWNGGADKQNFSVLRSVVPDYPLTIVRINEVLTHTDLPDEDWIELYNTTASPIDLGGWYLSDDISNPTLFQFPPGTLIDAGGFVVIGESELGFALSSTVGERVTLSEAAPDGVVTGGRDFIEFGAAVNGVSFGRSPDGTGNLYPMVEPTKAKLNSEPVVGPIVINEIMYHPADPVDGGYATNLEYIELKNVTDGTERLFTIFSEVNAVHPWRLTGAVQFDFSLDTSVPSGGLLLVVGFDPNVQTAELASFRTAYGLDSSVSLVGPYSDKLGNLGETVRLRKPDTPQPADSPDAGLVPYVLVDAVPYTNRSPWPMEAAGTGSSLERLDANSVGDMPTNWAASSSVGGTPGAVNSVSQVDSGIPGSSGTSGSCGAVGMVNMALIIVGLFALRLRYVR